MPHKLKGMIHIIDNRNEKADFEITEDGYGKWYAWNDKNDKCIGCKYKYEAQEIKNYPEDWDI